MAEIIGVRFKNMGRVYYFDPVGIAFSRGDTVVVENSGGIECGEVATSNRDVPESELVKPLKKVLRKAAPEDLRRIKDNNEKQKKAFSIANEKITHHELDMKLTEVEYAFDGSKITFYFTSAERVDFRALVKDLASVFRTRIELRQIGVRDEAKMLGGYGICGQPFCCSRFLNDFQPVSIKMAKEQGLSLNPTKISGSCGRLMCCLKYEQDTYEELLRITPKYGAIVMTEEGRGVVVDSNILTGRIKVRLDKSPDSPPAVVLLDTIKIIRDGRSKSDRHAKELRELEE